MDLEDGSEPTASLGPTSKSSQLTANLPTMETNVLPILPQFQFSPFVFDVDSKFRPHEGGSRKRIGIPTYNSIGLSEPDFQVVSPTRTLFPSVSGNIFTVDPNTVAQEPTTFARRASLRYENRKLEEKRDRWYEKYDAMEKTHRELKEVHDHLLVVLGPLVQETISQDILSAESTTASQGPTRRERAITGSLIERKKELEEEWRFWKGKHEEIETRHRELEKVHKVVLALRFELEALGLR